MKRKDPRIRRAYLKHAKSAGPTKGWANEYYTRARSQGQDHSPPKLFQTDRIQGFNRWYRIKIKPDLWLYFSGTEFVLIKQIEEKYIYSIVYGSRDAAMIAYKYENITWRTTKPVVADTPSA